MPRAEGADTFAKQRSTLGMQHKGSGGHGEMSLGEEPPGRVRARREGNGKGESGLGKDGESF